MGEAAVAAEAVAAAVTAEVVAVAMDGPARTGWISDTKSMAREITISSGLVDRQPTHNSLPYLWEHTGVTILVPNRAENYGVTNGCLHLRRLFAVSEVVAAPIDQLSVVAESLDVTAEKFMWYTILFGILLGLCLR